MHARASTWTMVCLLATVTAVLAPQRAGAGQRKKVARTGLEKQVKRQLRRLRNDRARTYQAPGGGILLVDRGRTDLETAALSAVRERMWAEVPPGTLVHLRVVEVEPVTVRAEYRERRKQSQRGLPVEARLLSDLVPGWKPSDKKPFQQHEVGGRAGVKGWGAVVRTRNFLLRHLVEEQELKEQAAVGLFIRG